MENKIKNQKGFIQAPLLVIIVASIIVVSTVITGTVLYKREKSAPFMANVSQALEGTKDAQSEVKLNELQSKEEQSLIEDTNQEENYQTEQELEQIRLENEKAQMEAEKAEQKLEQAKAEMDKLKAEQEVQRLAEEQQEQEELEEQQEAQRLAEEQQEQEELEEQQEAQRLAEEQQEQQEAQRLAEEKERQEAEEVKKQREIEQARQLELQRQLEIQHLAEEQQRLEENASQEPEPLAYLEFNKPYISKTGISVTVTNIEKIEEIGSYKYIISYKQENKTTDKELDEGTFKMFFEGDTGLPQYGFFNKLFPSESIARTYTFQILKTKKPFCVEFNDNLDAGLEGAFFRDQPATDTLKWRTE